MSKPGAIDVITATRTNLEQITLTNRITEAHAFAKRALEGIARWMTRPEGLRATPKPRALDEWLSTRKLAKRLEELLGALDTCGRTVSSGDLALLNETVLRLRGVDALQRKIAQRKSIHREDGKMHCADELAVIENEAYGLGLFERSV